MTPHHEVQMTGFSNTSMSSIWMKTVTSESRTAGGSSARLIVGVKKKKQRRHNVLQRLGRFPHGFVFTAVPKKAAPVIITQLNIFSAHIRSNDIITTPSVSRQNRTGSLFQFSRLLPHVVSGGHRFPLDFITDLHLDFFKAAY